MSINSKQKGARAERQFRDLLREFGLTARRGQQFAGGTDSPDVICDELNGRFHFEVKHVEKLNLQNAITQAITDAGSKTHIVAHRKNNWPWYVTLRADEFLRILLTSESFKGPKL